MKRHSAAFCHAHAAVTVSANDLASRAQRTSTVDGSFSLGSFWSAIGARALVSSHALSNDK
jgi:hypothetical protein